jgi:alpha-tubulin suppressor-like RCC1 family protein
MRKNRVNENPVRYEAIDNVRTLVESKSGFSLFITKNDELWGYGSNNVGQLGDGTGVDRDEPIKIMDNVANVYVFQREVYAVQNDGTLWRWGGSDRSNAVFYPEKVMESVVTMDFAFQSRVALQSNGTLIDISGDEPVTLETNVVDFSGRHILLGDGTLWEYTVTLNLNNWRELAAPTLERNRQIASNVTSFIVLAPLIFINETLFFINEENELWGIGHNQSSQLGDGTRINRDDPVKIMDDVLMVHPFRESRVTALKTDNTLWAWGADDVEPVLIAEDVIWINRNSFSIGFDNFWGYIDSSGTLWGVRFSGDLEPIPFFENIMIPQ